MSKDFFDFKPKAIVATAEQRERIGSCAPAAIKRIQKTFISFPPQLVATYKIPKPVVRRRTKLPLTYLD